MIKYGDLVQYTKENHVNWNTDLFDVLRGFFDSYSQQYSPQLPLPPSPSQPVQREIVFEDFKEPEDGEYSQQDLINLFST